MTARKQKGKSLAYLFTGRQHRPDGLVIKLHFRESLKAIMAAGGYATPEYVDDQGVARWKAEARLPKGDGKFYNKNFTYTTPADREQEARKIAAAWLRGERAEQAVKDAPWTVDDAHTHWQASLEETDGALTPGMMAVYRAEYAKEIGPVLGRIRLDALTDDHIRQFKKGLTNWIAQNGKPQPRMKRTIQRYLRRVRTILRFAREQGQLKKIPGDAVLKMKCYRVSDGGDVREHYPVSDDELGALLATVRTIASPSVAMACRLASIIGLREQEVTHLTLDTLFLDADIPHVWIRSKPCRCALCLRRKDGLWKPKSKRERKIPLPPELVTEMRAYMAVRATRLVGRDSSYVFPLWSRGKRNKAGAQSERSTFNDAVRRATITLGIEVDKTRQILTFHTLRSVAATNLDTRSNGNQTAVSVALGHALPAMSDRYNRLRERLPELYAALYPDAVDGPKLVPSRSQTGVKRIA